MHVHIPKVRAFYFSFLVKERTFIYPSRLYTGSTEGPMKRTSDARNPNVLLVASKSMIKKENTVTIRNSLWDEGGGRGGAQLSMVSHIISIL